MKLKGKKHLELLAKKAGIQVEQVEKQIINELIKNGIIEENTDNYGYSVFDCINRDIVVNELIKLLNSIGIKNVTYVHLDALFSLTIIGNGDCPVCGGEMEVVDGEYKCCAGDGYITQHEYEPIWEEIKCKNCGYKSEIKKRYYKQLNLLI